MPFVHWLHACPEQATAGIGGKAASLVRLQAGGFPVPAGFVVEAAGYRTWVERTGLREAIDALLAVPNLRQPKVAREASAA